MARQALLDKSGRWWIVLPTPNAGTLEKGKAIREKDRQQPSRAAEQITALPDSIRDELVAQVKEGRIMASAYRYSEATGDEIPPGLVVARQLQHSRANPGR